MHERSTAAHGRRFPAVTIHHAVWLYPRFPLSFRDVEELLAERGIELSYESLLDLPNYVSIRTSVRSVQPVLSIKLSP
jgi:hypothetical protein